MRLPSVVHRIARGELGYRVRTALLDRRESDQFIAAFPRSGSTWLRTMLTDVLVPGADGNPSVFNARIPGIKLRRIRALRQRESPRLMMTHSPWQPALGRVVYVVRDGRAALVSYYHYLTTRKGMFVPFDQFYERYNRGEYGVTWDRHVRGWLGAGVKANPDNIKVVRFETMLADARLVLADVCDFLSIEHDEDRIAYAAGRASLENARQIEAQRRGPQATGDASFYRGGTSRSGPSLLSGDVLDHFLGVARDALDLAGYEG